LLGLGELTWGLLGRCCWWCCWEQRPFQSQVLLLYAAWLGYKAAGGAPIAALHACKQTLMGIMAFEVDCVNGPPLWAVNGSPLWAETAIVRGHIYKGQQQS
jgi:hypothetical protein